MALVAQSDSGASAKLAMLKTQYNEVESRCDQLKAQLLDHVEKESRCYLSLLEEC